MGLFLQNFSKSKYRKRKYYNIEKCSNVFSGGHPTQVFNNANTKIPMAIFFRTGLMFVSPPKEGLFETFLYSLAVLLRETMLGIGSLGLI